MFKIGEFSKLSNTTVRTLDHYAALGLLKPEKKDDQPIIGITRQDN